MVAIELIVNVTCIVLAIIFIAAFICGLIWNLNADDYPDYKKISKKLMIPEQTSCMSLPSLERAKQQTSGKEGELPVPAKTPNKSKQQRVKLEAKKITKQSNAKSSETKPDDEEMDNHKKSVKFSIQPSSKSQKQAGKTSRKSDEKNKPSSESSEAKEDVNVLSSRSAKVNKADKSVPEDNEGQQRSNKGRAGRENLAAEKMTDYQAEDWLNVVPSHKKAGLIASKKMALKQH